MGPRNHSAFERQCVLFLLTQNLQDFWSISVFAFIRLFFFVKYFITLTHTHASTPLATHETDRLPKVTVPLAESCRELNKKKNTNDSMASEKLFQTILLLSLIPVFYRAMWDAAG